MRPDRVMRRHRHAKIVATVGPASSAPDRLKALFLAGVDTFRLNFSHDDHAEVHASIRALEAEVGRPIGILQDLQGPKIRIGTVKDGRRWMSAPRDALARPHLDGAERAVRPRWVGTAAVCSPLRCSARCNAGR